MECPSCDGEGCGDCNGEGSFRLTSCPLRMVDGDLWEAASYAALYQKGLAPIGGGALDQAKWFTEFAPFLWSEQQRIKNEKGLIDADG